MEPLSVVIELDFLCKVVLVSCDQKEILFGVKICAFRHFEENW